MIKVNQKPVLTKPKVRKTLRGKKRVDRMHLKAQIMNAIQDCTEDELLLMLRYMKEVKTPYITLGTAEKNKFYKLVILFDLKGYVDVHDFVEHFGFNFIEILEKMKTNRIIRITKKDYIYFTRMWSIYGELAKEVYNSIN